VSGGHWRNNSKSWALNSLVPCLWLNILLGNGF
jgi:hypothetical protein